MSTVFEPRGIIFVSANIPTHTHTHTRTHTPARQLAPVRRVTYGCTAAKCKFKPAQQPVRPVLPLDLVAGGDHLAPARPQHDGDMEAGVEVEADHADGDEMDELRDDDNFAVPFVGSKYGFVPDDLLDWVCETEHKQDADGWPVYSLNDEDRQATVVARSGLHIVCFRSRKNDTVATLLKEARDVVGADVTAGACVDFLRACNEGLADCTSKTKLPEGWHVAFPCDVRSKPAARRKKQTRYALVDDEEYRPAAGSLLMGGLGERSDSGAVARLQADARPKRRKKN